MDAILTRLSPDLHDLYKLELSLGNEVERIEEPAGTECPYCVVFKQPLHKSQIDSGRILSSSILFAISEDPHYPLESIYQSQVSKHAISGPLNK